MLTHIKTQYHRGRAAVGLIKTLGRGFYNAYRAGSFHELEPPRDKLTPHIQTFCHDMAKSFGVQIVQVQDVPQRHGLWVSNHVSWLDIAVVGSVAPVFFLSKSEISQWPIFGRLARAGGTLFIKRGSGDSSFISDQIAKFLQRGHSVVFFPEATTTDGRQIKKIYGKLLKAAIDTDLPICPMVIAYADIDGRLSDAAAYYGDRSMATSLKLVVDAKNITAYVLPLEPIYPQGKSQVQLTDELQQAMEEGLARLHAQVLTA